MLGNRHGPEPRLLRPPARRPRAGQLDPEQVAVWLESPGGQRWSQSWHTPVTRWRESRPGVFADVIEDHRWGDCEYNCSLGSAYWHPGPCAAIGSHRAMQDRWGDMWDPDNIPAGLSCPA